MKILIIDDETLIRQSLSYVAKIKGHSCQTASTAKTGLEIWNHWKPDLVFLDIMLPDDNGLSLISKAPITAVAFMSAHSQNEAIIKKKNLGLFLVKPFENIFQTFDHVVSFFHSSTTSAEL